MAFSFRSIHASLAEEPVGQDADSTERTVTVVAASVAVLIVAAIAVLMGMA
jgi:hypothetical protein